jgi:hypothetical protein
MSLKKNAVLKAFSAGIRFFELRKFDPSSISEFKRSFSEAKIERSEVKIAVNFDKIKKKPWVALFFFSRFFSIFLDFFVFFSKNFNFLTIFDFFAQKHHF